MCGIYAEFNIKNNSQSLSLEKTRIKSILSGLRGKDYIGTWESEDQSVLIFHSLLSISGEIKTIQPIKIKNKVFVFNGEIYSFGNLETKSSFQKKFIDGSKLSDTEKLIFCIEEFGLNNTLLSINGMYSILIYDLKNNNVEVANDPFEQKPLYFSLSKKKLIFSSIQALASQRKIIGASFYDESLVYSYPISSGSIYNDVEKIQGGFKYCFGISEEFNYSKSTYFKKFTGFKKYINKKNTLIRNRNQKLLRQKIIESIERSVKGLNNVNILLSGGIDSTLIAAILIKELNIKVKGHHLFGYSNNDKEDYERLKISHKLLKNLDLYKYKFSNDHSLLFLNNNPELVLNNGLAPLSSILAQIPSSERVLLSGLGADELFLGYGRHFENFYKEKKFPYFFQNFRNIFPILINRSTRINFFTINKYSHYIEIKDSFFPREFVDFLKIKIPESIKEDTIQKHDIEHALPKFFNPLNDIVGMFFSREIRSPFLDNEISIELNKSNFDYKNMLGKKFLKDMLVDYGFTKDWINHSKIGFGTKSLSLYKWKKIQLDKKYL